MSDEPEVDMQLVEELAQTDMSFAEIKTIFGEEVAIEVGIAKDPDTFRIDAEWMANAMTTDELLVAYPELKVVFRPSPDFQEAPEKESIQIQLDADVVAFFRSLGTGWENKLNHILRNVVFPEGEGDES